MKLLERLAGQQPDEQIPVEIIENQLRELNAREIELGTAVKSATTGIEVDAAQREIIAVRGRRIALFAKRNVAQAAEARAKAATLRQEAQRLRDEAKPHMEALTRLGYNLREVEGTSHKLDRSAYEHERTARVCESRKASDSGNVRAKTLPELIQNIYANIDTIPPTIASITEWVEQQDQNRFGGRRPDVPRGYHVIWRNSRIVTENSKTYWDGVEA